MDRNVVIKELRQFFDIHELVGRAEYLRDKDLCWRYFRTDFLHTLLVIRRDIIKSPMTVNTWKEGGSFDERGFRSNISAIVNGKTKAGKLYISAHSLGCGIDFTAKDMDAEKARRLIADNNHILPYPIRLEMGTSWVHFDMYNEGPSKIQYFYP